MLRNPVSRDQWSLHQSIKEIKIDEEDQEALFVVAKPTDGRTFLSVRSLLDGVQREIDLSWAVLGEVYSRFPDLRQLGIRLRRIRSNIDNLGSFRKSVNYIPLRFTLESEGSGLIKKLTAPLYGESPEVGIRELLQNAVDAVNELHHVLGSSAGRSETEIFVRVDGDKDNGGWVTVEDFGIGMTEEVIRLYYLRVGASFRDSDAWRKAYTVRDDPKIIRSGRFGIGMLAGFLLGESLEVVTRSYQRPPDEAFTFKVTIDDEAIEVQRATRLRPGTTVRVRIDGSTFDRLSTHDSKEWDWYRWSDPKVTRTLNGEELPSLPRVPGPRADLDLVGQSDCA